MSEITNAIKQVCDEKGLSYDAVMETVESALAAAYRKDFGNKLQNIKVEFDPETGKIKAYDVKTVVEDLPDEEEKTQKEREEKEVKKDKDKKEDKKSDKDEKKDEKGEDKDEKESASNQESEEEKRRFNPKIEIQLSDARKLKKTAKIDDVIRTKLEVPAAFGRMAAQTAKQVIIQKLREAEREMVYSEFKTKEDEVVSGIVQRMEGNRVLIDLGRAVGILPPEEQIPGEKYKPGDRLKVYIKEVNMMPRGAEIVLSRTSEEILKKVFYLEIPEISNSLIELKAVAREAGSRSKVAVIANSENIDPIGSCVGQRGARIQTIINELGGEKIDIIEYDEDSAKFIANALSPAKVADIQIDEENKKALVIVSPDQLSLAIGKGGQNARLAARLTEWKIDIGEIKEEKENKKDEQDNKKDDKTSKTQEKNKDEGKKENKDEN